MSSTKLVVLSAWLSRLVAAFATIYALRVLSHSLSSPEYATFVVIVGLIGWFALSDFGLGFAVQNAVTNRLATGGDGASEIVGAYLLLLATTGLTVLLVFVFKGPIAETLFFKISGGSHESGAQVFFQSALLLVIGASAAMSTKILYAQQRGYVANIAAALSSVAGLLLLTKGTSSADDRITYAVIALYGPNAVLGCAFALTQVVRALRSKVTLSSGLFRRLASSSRGFFVFYFMAAAVLQIDYLVMSQKVAPVEIIQYYCLAKLFAFISFFNQAILSAAWPVMTARFAAGELSELRLQLTKLVIWSAAFTLLATLAILATRDRLGDFIAPGTEVQLRIWVIVGFGMLTLMRCVTDPFAIFLQSIGRLTPLIVCAAVQAIIGASLQWVLAGTLGIEGILIALVVSFVTTAAWVLPWSARKILSPSTQPAGTPA